ncbi:hypothetical protein TeGR_g4719 [Tetraparma gracilis]|uniref:DNA-directed RNA polymerase III subunit RPC3 n=1 Tax=Tetraparma gracilis TaxID=2962635 RepID=A0ABQ6MSD7_9STRA|nr:hypothetical protein TeGR_g4719 [Tetraparma gracilis]
MSGVIPPHSLSSAVAAAAALPHSALPSPHGTLLTTASALPAPPAPPISARTHSKSPISTAPHDPLLSLSSSLVLDHFGPSVQTVYDCLLARGPLSLQSLLSFLSASLSKKPTPDRAAVILAARSLPPPRADLPPPFAALRPAATVDSEAAGYVVNQVSVKGALLVLTAHGICGVADARKEGARAGRYVYEADGARAARLARYAKYAVHAGGHFGEAGGAVVRALLGRGILRTETAVEEAAVAMWEEGGGVEGDERGKDKFRREAMGAFERLREADVVVRRYPLLHDEGIPAAEPSGQPPAKKARGAGGAAAPAPRAAAPAHAQPDNELVASLVEATRLHAGSVWEVNVSLLDKRLKSGLVGRFVRERCGFEGREGWEPSEGMRKIDDVVTAALWSVAAEQEARVEKNRKQCWDNKVPYKKIGDGLGGAPVGSIRPGAAVAAAGKSEHMQLTEEDVEEGLEALCGESNGGGRGVMCKRDGAGKYTICYNDILRMIKDRMIDDLIRQRFGTFAARVFATLRREGGLLDAAGVSTIAMITEKEAREALNVLMQHQLCTWHDLPLSKQFNYNTTVYLWSLDEARVNISVRNMLRTAFLNARDRRRVYMTSDKAAVFDRLKVKAATGFQPDKAEHSEADKLEEKEAKKNLDILDQIAQDIDYDMIFWSEEPQFVRTFDKVGYGSDCEITVSSGVHTGGDIC